MFVIEVNERLSNELGDSLQHTSVSKDVKNIYRWDMCLVTVKQRKCVIIVNKETGLNLTLFDLRQAQFENMSHVLRGSLKQLFQLLEMKSSITEHMLKEAEEIEYLPLGDEEPSGMVKAVQQSVEKMVTGLDYEEIDAVHINLRNNREMNCESLKGRTPYETFVNYFQ
ncbi:hypothetical protein MUN89_04335 [Halobacillus salinarum]|uniref:DUF6933 domain-containing protein n=1 Tax=Halobacillus salinarum TaxID=2932257 RepID=A0ABY4ELY5_9BACI|nr:hypothetical protein [Halobacillus salinarum]UOQ45184.1 hypothetical protein MUN89_04335 [Halobacillus salinarum]